MTLRLGVAVDFAASGLTGIGVYGRELIRGLAADPTVDLTAYSARDARPSAACRLPELKEVGIPRWPLPTTLRKSLYFAVTPVAADVVHETVQMGFLFPTRSRFRKVVTVFDLAPLHFPEFYPWYKGTFYRRAMARSLRHADAIVTDSAVVADDLRTVFGLSSDRMRRVTVTPLAAGDQFRPLPSDPAFREKYGITGHTLLVVGMLSPHKNLGRIIRAFLGVAETDPAARLIVAGKRGWQCDAEIELMRRHPERIRWLKYVADEDLVRVYSAAAGLVFPSLYEGFGMPILEAQACGCPVITSRGGATEQTAGGGALLVDPFSEAEIHGAMRNLLDDRPRRDDLVARGRENVARFAWQDTVALTRAVYRAVME